MFIQMDDSKSLWKQKSRKVLQSISLHLTRFHCININNHCMKLEHYNLASRDRICLYCIINKPQQSYVNDFISNQDIYSGMTISTVSTPQSIFSTNLRNMFHDLFSFVIESFHTTMPQHLVDIQVHKYPPEQYDHSLVPPNMNTIYEQPQIMTYIIAKSHRHKNIEYGAKYRERKRKNGY